LPAAKIQQPEKLESPPTFGNSAHGHSGTLGSAEWRLLKDTLAPKTLQTVSRQGQRIFVELPLTHLA
jgi:hypothetical protein